MTTAAEVHALRIFVGVVTTIGLNNVGKVQLTSKFLLPSVPVAVVRIMLAQAAQLLGSF